jgi:hypothetical protein
MYVIAPIYATNILSISIDLCQTIFFSKQKYENIIIHQIYHTLIASQEKFYFKIISSPLDKIWPPLANNYAMLVY